jgi:predicted HicB family RNase H-like nuclease
MSKYRFGRDVDLDKEVVLDARGRRITEKRATQIARETVRRGRPSLTGGSHHSPQVSIRMSEDLYRRVERHAARQHKSLSETGREALEQYLQRQSA